MSEQEIKKIVLLIESRSIDCFRQALYFIDTLYSREVFIKCVFRILGKSKAKKLYYSLSSIIFQSVKSISKISEDINILAIKKTTEECFYFLCHLIDSDKKYNLIIDVGNQFNQVMGMFFTEEE